MRGRLIFAFLAAAAAGLLTVLGVQRWEDGQRLKLGLAQLGRDEQTAAQLRAANQGLAAQLKALPDAKTLRQRHAAIERMRAALDRMRMRERKAKLALGLPSDPVWPDGAEVRAAKEWEDRGQGSPMDTVETVLWSARTGDVDRLAGLIALDPDAEKAADSLYGGLSDAAREQYGSPEEVLATLISGQMPTNYEALAPVSERDVAPDARLLVVRLEDGSGAQQDLTFKFQKTDDNWRMDVPAAVVNRFAAQLKSGGPIR